MNRLESLQEEVSKLTERIVFLEGENRRLQQSSQVPLVKPPVNDTLPYTQKEVVYKEAQTTKSRTMSARALSLGKIKSDQDNGIPSKNTIFIEEVDDTLSFVDNDGIIHKISIL